MYQKYFKRLFDIILSLILILLLFPLMVLIFICVWTFIGYPIFTQKRPGLNNRVFTLYKFKTLYDSSKYISEKQKQNALGNFLRRTSLDELPQLFNILENKMSFVGPRPLLVKYLKIKAFKNHERRKCLPGITGLAQVDVFNKSIVKKRKSKWIDQFNSDKKYYKYISFKLDLLIILKTVTKLVSSNKIDYYKETKLSSKYFN
tara:strand:- start:484 stop:1092 length:609 start_codon:yes stop_codon:yes gene_type:complete